MWWYTTRTMNILITYMTNAGGTYLMARTIRDVLNKKHTVTLKKATEVSAQDIPLYDVLVIGSPSWNVNGKEGQPHEAILDLLEDLRRGKNVKKLRTATFGSGDSSYTNFCGAVDIISEALKQMGTSSVHSPLKVDELYFHLDKNLNDVERWTKQLMKAF